MEYFYTCTLAVSTSVAIWKQAFLRELKIHFRMTIFRITWSNDVFIQKDLILLPQVIQNHYVMSCIFSSFQFSFNKQFKYNFGFKSCFG